MARGWESKSVEDQQAERSQPPSVHPRLTSGEAALQRQLGALQLSRKMVEQQLSSATSPARRQMLESALADLDLRIRRTQSGSV